MIYKRRHVNFAGYIYLLSAVYERSHDVYIYASRYHKPESVFYTDSISFAKQALYEQLEFIARRLCEFEPNEDRRQALEIIKGAADLIDNTLQKDRYNADIANKKMLEYLRKAKSDAEFIRLTSV